MQKVRSKETEARKMRDQGESLEWPQEADQGKQWFALICTLVWVLFKVA
jgi:hypothetical protein